MNVSHAAIKFTLVALFTISMFGISGTTSAFAERVMYVKPDQKITIRRGTGVEYKIIQMVEIGSQVDLLKQAGDYAKVRLNNGKEGWVLRRFLEAGEPADVILQRIQSENEQLRKEHNAAMKKAAEAIASLKETQKQFTSVLQERNTLLGKYQQLQADTRDVVNLRREQQATARENDDLKHKLIAAQDESVLLKKGTQLKWYLAGAGVLFLGVLLGKIPPPRRKEKSYLS
ncbi:TIGR04211 family SH3 domain-containing protein [Desulforhopalus vacuolatus]|uniref:TIGR04211 family SH3 domain-containing protein n=1 Tax=Desulforhopalus vacuolatus TaxID=40414 RepID=UPI00196390BF|nr:TIGR04211 family SH3 domain-containing protein [Desulforhopalus vacuolatus]MBM9519080.1 TIGR04211 family SH3 domain-containing protein [Desulforhopalus vacuolatus]